MNEKQWTYEQWLDFEQMLDFLLKEKMIAFQWYDNTMKVNAIPTTYCVIDNMVRFGHDYTDLTRFAYYHGYVREEEK